MKEKKRDNKDLAAKMAAYAATALSALAVAHPASAAIVYNGPHNISVPANGSVSIDLDGNSTNDFRFWLETFQYHYRFSTILSSFPTSLFPSSFSSWYVSANGWYMSATGVNGQFINAKPGFYNSDIMNLPAGYSIKGSLQHPTSRYWTSGSQTVAGSFSGKAYIFGTTYSLSYTTGNFTNEKGYMGVRFHANCTGPDNWNYGWIYIDAAGSGGLPNTSVPQIVDWAYETDCNTPIKAGERPPEPVPALDEWGMIALAALLSGTAIRRMKKGQSKA